MSMEQGAHMHPALLAVRNAEIFEHATTGGKFFSERYPLISETCQKNTQSYLLVTGENGAGKTALAMGIKRTMEVDEGLAGHKIIPVPFALFGQVAKLKGEIPPHVSHGQYTSEQYRAITKRMHIGMQEYEYARPEQNVVFIIEMSTPSVYPDVQDVLDLPWRTDEKGELVPVRSGSPTMVRDRGHSVGYTYALDQRRAKATQMVIVERSEGVKKVTQDVRRPDNPDVIGNLTEAGFTVLLEDANKNPIDLTRLPQETKNALNDLLGITYAPAATIDKSDQELLATRKSILHTPIVSQRGYYQWLREQLLMSAKRFSVVQNEYKDGEKTFDIRYFLDSLVYEQYPQLLSPLIAELVRSRLLSVLNGVPKSSN